MTCAPAAEWILLLGDIGITECTDCIPPQFLKLISNLKANTSTKHVVCTGNLGSDGAALQSYFLSLLGGEKDRLIISNSFLNCCCISEPSELNSANERTSKVSRLNAGSVLECCGLKIGVCNGYQFLPLLRDKEKDVQLMPSPEAIFSTSVDLILHSHTHRQTITRTNDGVVLISPGCLTGHVLLPAAKLPRETNSAEEEAEAEEVEGEGEDLATLATPKQTDDETDCKPDKDEEETPGKGDGDGDGCPAPSFTLISIDENSISVFDYVLDAAGQVQVSQTSLGHPRPVSSSEEEGSLLLPPTAAVQVTQ